jgi:hypothetical protein
MCLRRVCFRSHKEGFGIAQLKVQESGLLCLYSSCIPRNAIVDNFALPCRLVAGVEVWARRILDLLHFGADYNSRITRVAKLPRMFNVAELADKLEMFYLYRRLDT